MTSSVSHERASEVDTLLADIWEREQRAPMNIYSAIQSLHSYLGHKRNWHARKGESEYAESAADTEAEARAVLATPPAEPGRSRWWVHYDNQWHLGTYGEYIQRAVEEIDAARIDAKAARLEAQPLEAEYRADPWQRYFLVMNVGGHIHTTRSCSTTYPTTQWSWLPSLSGLGEDAAVAQEGPRLCSICYPSAPVEWTLGLPKKLNPNRCDGSSQQGIDIDRRYYSARGKCPVCGEWQSVSSTGKVRPHNKPKEAKA